MNDQAQTWEQYRHHVVSELQRLSEQVDRLGTVVTDLRDSVVRLQTLYREDDHAAESIPRLERDLARLRARGPALAAGASGGSVFVAELLRYLLF